MVGRIISWSQSCSLTAETSRMVQGLLAERVRVVGTNLRSSSGSAVRPRARSARRKIEPYLPLITQRMTDPATNIPLMPEPNCSRRCGDSEDKSSASLRVTR
jgi:hypothetical protein